MENFPNSLPRETAIFGLGSDGWSCMRRAWSCIHVSGAKSRVAMCCPFTNPPSPTHRLTWMEAIEGPNISCSEVRNSIVLLLSVRAARSSKHIVHRIHQPFNTPASAVVCKLPGFKKRSARKQRNKKKENISIRKRKSPLICACPFCPV